MIRDQARCNFASDVVKTFLRMCTTDWRNIAENCGSRGQGLCYDASLELVEWCKRHNLLVHSSVRIVALRDHGGPGTYCGEDCHWVVLLWDRVVVDLTARQFDDDLPFPHVFVVERYDWDAHDEVPHYERGET